MQHRFGVTKTTLVPTALRVPFHPAKQPRAPLLPRHAVPCQPQAIDILRGICMSKQVARRDFVKCAGAAAVGIAAAAALDTSGAYAAGAQDASGQEEYVDPLTVTTSPDEAIAPQDVQDDVAYNKARGDADPDYGARIAHVFGANSIVDYYLFDGFTGIGVYEGNESIRVADLVMEPAGGAMGEVVLKDGGAGDADSLVRDVRSMVYTTPEGTSVQLKAQSLHGAQPRLDGMVVFADNKPGKLARSVTVPLSLFDSDLSHGINYLLQNPDSGKHNTSGDDDGFTETTLKFWYNEDDQVHEGLQHVYTKYAYNGDRNYWLYIESENQLDVRFDKLGTGDPDSADYVPGTALNMSVHEPAFDGCHAEVEADASAPGRLGFTVPIDDVFYFDPEDPTVVQNASLTNQREFQFWRAEVVGDNTALAGDVEVSCDLDCPGGVYFSVSCDAVSAGEFELAVSCSAGRGTGWPTEWSAQPATIRVRVK